MNKKGYLAAAAVKVLEGFGPPGLASGHVFNLGHGISQHTPAENVAVLAVAVHAHARRMRGARTTAA